MWHPKKRSVEGVGEKVNVALHIVRGWRRSVDKLLAFAAHTKKGA